MSLTHKKQADETPATIRFINPKNFPVKVSREGGAGFVQVEPYSQYEPNRVGDNGTYILEGVYYARHAGNGGVLVALKEGEHDKSVVQHDVAANTATIRTMDPNAVEHVTPPVAVIPPPPVDPTHEVRDVSHPHTPTTAKEALHPVPPSLSATDVDNLKAVLHDAGREADVTDADVQQLLEYVANKRAGTVDDKAAHPPLVEEFKDELDEIAAGHNPTAEVTETSTPPKAHGLRAAAAKAKAK